VPVTYISLRLPNPAGALQDYRVRGPGDFKPAAPGTRLDRIAYSAAHVVADARAAGDPWLQRP
jgi:hypothetical protein